MCLTLVIPACNFSYPTRVSCYVALKNRKGEIISIGSRVKVSDSLLFKNDVDTPLSVTMVNATVTRVYKDSEGRGIINVRTDRVRFPHLKGKIRHRSNGHFLNGVELLV